MIPLFDLDGTGRYRADLIAALNECAPTHGRSRRSPIFVATSRRAGCWGRYGVGPDDPAFPALRDAFLTHARRWVPGPLAGVATLLDAIGGLNGASHQKGAFHGPLLDALQLSSAHAVVCGDTTPHTKPHPAPLFAAERLGSSAASTLGCRATSLPVRQRCRRSLPLRLSSARDSEIGPRRHDRRSVGTATLVTDGPARNAGAPRAAHYIKLGFPGAPGKPLPPRGGERSELRER